eukprot:CAMPEP_0115705394 /NCGR_PEP_ID=MMETSP0272-20121206/70197_1 /TAXON_ID=71861 /ORGANISM="Scrippsiella trochoidea, Strain CCMP3099" /LENGTH=92 /DNA_ID=CAMNT_0003146499 /DNA_START=103 /DNA_END=378 /DNA_ORIENTATION=+
MAVSSVRIQSRALVSPFRSPCFNFRAISERALLCSSISACAPASPIAAPALPLLLPGVGAGPRRLGDFRGRPAARGGGGPRHTPRPKGRASE